MIVNLKNEKHFFFVVSLLALSYVTYLVVIWVEYHFFSYEVKGFLHMLHAFTVPVIFFGYLYIFDNWAWKWKAWTFMSVVDYPNIGGEYKGRFISSYKDENGNAVTGEVNLSIKQTASKVIVNGKFNQSESVSIQSFFAFNDYKGKPCLYYFYKSKPNKNAAETMHAHEGSAVLCYDNQTKVLSGEYYSGRDRNNYGDLELTMIS